MTLGIFIKNWMAQGNSHLFFTTRQLAVSVFCILVFNLGWNSAYANTNNFHTRLHQLQTDTWDENDVSVEIKFGKEISARILTRYKLLDDVKLTRYVSLVGTSLALHSTRTELAYHFAILDENTLNAFSAPGGYIFISKGLLDFIADESELAGILAHEIAHISQRHIVNALNIRGASREELSSVARFIGASAGTTGAAFSQAIDKAMETLFDSGFEKNEELQADSEATLLLANTGYDPAALLRVLHRLEKNSMSKSSASVTHPSYSKRFQELKLQLSQETLLSDSFNRARFRYLTNIKKISVKGFTQDDSISR